MKKVLAILFILHLLSLSLLAQKAIQDTVLVNNDELLLTAETGSVVLNDTVWLPNPKKATMLSAAFPGMGQIYNRQWWKVPILYAGMGTLGYFIYWNNDLYVKYRNAYIDFVDDDPTTTRYYAVLPEGANVDDYDSSWLETSMENRKDSYRRDRDLLVIAMVGVYALNIIEANVAAHLYDFDVSDDLSLKVSPDLNYDFVNRQPMLGVSLRLNINK